MRSTALALIVVVAGVVVATANASQIISTSSVSGLTLGVNAKGEAMLTFTAHGKVVHVLAWGAVNAVPAADNRPQVAFHLLYDGGYRKTYTRNPVATSAIARLRSLQARAARASATKDDPERWALAPKIAAAYARLAALRAAAVDYWKTFSCPAYDGPPLAWLVVACKAPDGSYWAVQEWQRKLRNYGLPSTPLQSAMEVHLAHWTGELPVVTIDMNWAYKTYDHLYGTFSYRGEPVYGFRSTSQGQPLDRYGRNVYLDSYDSAYGPGWRRENSFLTHNPLGTFCYGFYPHAGDPAGNGTNYRATMLGPGVTPDVMWQGSSPGPYDPTAQAAADRAILSLDDPLCQQV